MGGLSSPTGFARAADLTLRLEANRLACAMALVAAPWEALEAAQADFLAPAEAALLTDRLAPARRQSFLAGRWAAKTALRRLAPDIPACDMTILPGAFGQPVATVPGRPNLQVTLAHAGPAALAVAHPEACPLGVDLERLRPDVLPTLRAQMTAQETMRASLLAEDAPPHDEFQRLLRLWCLKEALSKALRTGLTVPFALLETTELTPLAGGLRARFTHFAQYEGHAVAAGPYALALVRPRLTRWDEDGGTGAGPDVETGAATGAVDTSPPRLLKTWLTDLAAWG